MGGQSPRRLSLVAGAGLLIGSRFKFMLASGVGSVRVEVQAHGTLVDVNSKGHNAREARRRQRSFSFTRCFDGGPSLGLSCEDVLAALRTAMDFSTSHVGSGIWGDSRSRSRLRCQCGSLLLCSKGVASSRQQGVHALFGSSKQAREQRPCLACSCKANT